jgi:hypothetical protein
VTSTGPIDDHRPNGQPAGVARLFDMSTGDIGELSQPGRPLYNIEVSNGGLITFPGGVPLRDASGRIVGAVGVSGRTVDTTTPSPPPQASSPGRRSNGTDHELQLRRSRRRRQPGQAVQGRNLGWQFGSRAWSMSPPSADVCSAISMCTGRFDSQSLAGKVPCYLIGLADSAAVPIALVAGAVQAPTDMFAAAYSLSRLAGSTEAAIAHPLPWLEHAGSELARSFPAWPATAIRNDIDHAAT